MKSKSAKKQITFEQAYSRLEEIVGMIERGNASLQETLTLLKEGSELVAWCNAELESATQTVTELKKEIA